MVNTWDTHMKQVRKGYTLVEVMIVILIIGILIAVTLPAYINYSNRATFSELMVAATPRKTAIVLAIEVLKPVNTGVLNGGAMGIPPDTAVGPAVHGASVSNGVITMTWQTDGSVLSGITYSLSASGITPPIEWTEGGTCSTNSFC